MNMPGFTAERSLDAARGRYRSGRQAASRSGTVVPAIPNCANCDYILDRCAANGDGRAPSATPAQGATAIRSRTIPTAGLNP